MKITLHFLARLLTNRYSLAVFNLLILAIIISSLRQMMPLAHNLVEDIGTFDDIADAIATILVAYGVALEERGTLMRVFGLYPRYHDIKQRVTDKLSETSGMIFLVLGLFIEVLVELLLIPNSIINTAGREWLIFLVNALFFIASAAALLFFTWQLLKPPPAEKVLAEA